MKLLVGLGNSGNQYNHTRHNLGYEVVEFLSKKWKLHFSKQSKLNADICITMQNQETIILAKPLPYVNLSGNTVQKIKNFYKLSNYDIWVISDDIDLEFGKIRTRIGGSSGGHNGLKDIIEKIGDNFVRIRIGIKTDELNKMDVSAFVLQKFNKNEKKSLDKIISQTANIIEDCIENKSIKHQSKTI